MRTLFTIITIAATMLLNQDSVIAQNIRTDSLARERRARQLKLSPQEQKNQQRNYYKVSLKVDSLKAERIMKVQSNYKTSMKALEADQSMSKENRSARIKALMEEKNSKLEELLDASQQAKVIPPGEPRRSKQPLKDNKKD